MSSAQLEQRATVQVPCRVHRRAGRTPHKGQDTEPSLTVLTPSPRALPLVRDHPLQHLGQA